MQKNGSKTRMLAYTALVAAVYAVLTVGVAPLSYGMIQIRFSERLCHNKWLILTRNSV